MQSAIWRAGNTRDSVLGDALGVRARDSAWACNLHPRQQSGFGHRIIAVKPLLTVWFHIAAFLRNLNVPWDAIVAMAWLHWNLLFFNVCSFFCHAFLPCPLQSSLSLCNTTTAAAAPAACCLQALETAAAALWQVFLARLMHTGRRKKIK